MAQLHHLALRTHDIPALLQFYQRWFQLPIVCDTRPRSVWLGLEHEAVLMIEAAAPEEPPVPVGSYELMAFRVSSEERAALRAALVGEGLLEGETEHTLYFRDPDGRRVGASSFPLEQLVRSRGR